MRKHILKASMLSIVTAVVIGLTACSSSSDGGSSATGTTSSSGSASKGPFKQGSLVVAYKLSAIGDRITDTNQTTVTTDGRGNFSFASIPWSGPTEFVISGEYLNENTGTYMTLPLSKGLSAVSNITAGSAASVNINVLTNIAAQQIKQKMHDGADISTAKAEAETDVKELFNIKLDAGVSLDDLDPTETGTNSEANTQLLLVSSAILNTTNPDNVMQTLAEDLSDGAVDGSAIAALKEVKTAVNNVNLAEVASNLESANIGVENVPTSVDAALEGLLAFDHNISFTPAYDAFRSTPYTSNEVVVDGIYGGTGAISIQNGEYSIDGAPFTSAAGTISNGQTLQLRTTSAADYSTETAATLTLGGATISYVVKTKDDPFVADTTPAPFSFTPLFDKPRNTEVNATITVSGINTAAPISIDTTDSIPGSEYSINGGAFTADPGTVNNDDNVTVRHTTLNAGGARSWTTINIGGVKATFNAYTVEDDTTPDVFTFAAAHDVDLNTTAEANATITGINTETPISIEGGEYSLDNGTTWNTNASTITNGDTVKVRATSATTYETSKEVKVTVGNVVGIFSVTTKPNPIVPDSTPNAFAFKYLADQNRSIDVVSNTITVSGINQPVAATVTNGFMDINSSGNWVTDANVTAGTTIQLKHTTSADFGTETVTALDIGGVSASFKSKTEVEDTVPDAFSFDRNESVSVGDTDVVSNTVTITGINTELNISVENGEYSLDNGATWTTAAGTVTNDTNVTLKQPTVATTPNTPKVTKVTVGNVTALFTTVTLPLAPDILEPVPTTATTATQDVLYTYTPELNASAGEVESWSIANKPSWIEFNTITGKVEGIPRNADVGTDANVTITATNATGSDSISFDITVLNVNDAPVAQDINVTMDEDTPQDINVSSYISDIDVNDTVRLVSVDANTSAGGTASMASNTANIIHYIPAPNFFGTDTFTYTVEDDNGSQATATVTLFIGAVNDAPVAHDDNLTTSEDTNLSITMAALIANDYDVDGNITTLVNETNTTHGTLYTMAAGGFTYVPGQDFNGTDVFTYRITDDGGLSAEANVTITVTPVNDAPLAVNDTVTLDEDTNVTLNVLANDSDVEGDALTLNGVTNSGEGATVSFDANGTLTYTPRANFFGTDTLTYTVTDGTAESNATVTFTVLAVNDAPVAVDSNFSVVKNTQDNPISFLSNVSDVDNEPADLSILECQDSNGTVTVNATFILYTPSTDFTGMDDFTCTVSDGDLNATAPLHIYVIDNEQPQFDDVVITLSEGEVVTGQFVATDPDDDNLTFAPLQRSATDANITVNEDGTYVISALHAGTAVFSVPVTDGITAIVSATVTVKVVIPHENSTNYEISEGPQLTSAEFDALSAGAAIPADTKLYDLWGADFNGTAFDRVDLTYLAFMSDGSFVISEDNATDYAHNEDLSSGKASVSTGTSYDANNKVADFVMLDANMSAADIAAEVPFLATLHLPADAVVYKTAVKMAQDEYDVWGTAQNCLTASCVAYASLSDMIDNNASGVIAVNRYNNRRALVFGPNQTFESNNSSGTIMEVDVTGIAEGSASEPVIINPNAGTWTATLYNDDANTDLDMIQITLASGMDTQAFPKNPILLESGFVDDEGNTNNNVSKGSFMPAGSAGIEYRFNEAVSAVVENYFHPVTIDDWITNVQDANNTELNATAYNDITGLAVDVVAGSPFFELEMEKEPNMPTVMHLASYKFNSDNTLAVTEFLNNLPVGIESLTYEIGGDNNITIYRSVDGSDRAIASVKIIAAAPTQSISLAAPADAQLYVMAGFQLTDEAHYEADANATVMDREGNITTGFDDNLTNFIVTVADNNLSFDTRVDGSGVMYALTLDNNDSNTSGAVIEVNLDTNDTAVVGGWDIRSIVDGNTTEDAIVVILDVNNSYNNDVIAFGTNGGSVLLRGTADLAGHGGFMYMANAKAAEYINLNFTNQFLLPFTYEELANQLLFGVFDDAHEIFTINYGEYRDNRRTVYTGCIGIGCSPAEIYGYVIEEDGSLLVLDGTYGDVLSRVTRNSRNDLFYNVTSVPTDGSVDENVTLFYNAEAANNYYNSIQP